MPVIQAIQAVAGRTGGPPPPPPPPPAGDFFWAGDNDLWVALGSFYAVNTFPTTEPAKTAHTYADGTTGFTRVFTGTECMVSPNLGIGGTWQSNTITIDLWFYPTANGVQLLGEYNSNALNSYRYTVLEIDSTNHVKAMFWQGGAVTSTNTVTLNAWNHVWFAEDSQGGHSFELNGIPTNSGLVYTRQGPGSTSEYFAIGDSCITNMGNTGCFQGKVGWINIHDYVVSSTYISTRYKFQPPALLVNLDASNPSSFTSPSTTWTNLVAGGPNATFNTAPAYINNGSKSIDFAGLYWATLPADVYFKQDFTIVAWVRLHSYASWERIIDFGVGPDQNNVLLAASAGTTGFPALRSESAQFQTTTTIPVSKWTQVVGKLNGTGLGTIFINGTAVATSSMTIPPGVTRTYCYIGKSNWGSDALLNGEIGELQIYDGALADSTIYANYNSTKSKYPNSYWVTTAHGLNAGWANSFQGANTVTIQDNLGLQPVIGWTVNDGTVTRTVSSNTIVRQGSAFGPILTMTLDGPIDDNVANVTILGA